MYNTLDILKEPLISEFIGNEKEFQQNVVEHIEEINKFLGLPDIKFIEEQKQIRMNGFQIIMDIIIKHIDDSVTIIEVKKANTIHPSTGTFNQMQGIGQLLLYQNMFELKTGIKPKLVLIDNKIYERTMYAFMGNNLPITLIELQKDRVFIPYRAW